MLGSFTSLCIRSIIGYLTCFCGLLVILAVTYVNIQNKRLINTSISKLCVKIQLCVVISGRSILPCNKLGL